MSNLAGGWAGIPPGVSQGARRPRPRTSDRVARGRSRTLAGLPDQQPAGCLADCPCGACTFPATVPGVMSKTSRCADSAPPRSMNRSVPTSPARMAAADKSRCPAASRSVKRMEWRGLAVSWVRAAERRGRAVRASGLPRGVGRRSSDLPAASVRVVRCSSTRTQSVGKPAVDSNQEGLSDQERLLRPPAPRTAQEAMLGPSGSCWN